MVIIPGVEVDEARLAAICDKYGIAVQHSHRQVGRNPSTRREDLSKAGHREGGHVTCTTAPAKG